MACLVRDVPVYYEVYGEGFPVILIHGYTPDHRLMTGSMEPVFANRSGWQRIYLDLPGMGRTPGAEWINGTDDMLDVVLEFIDKVIPDQHFLLVGESYGGYLSRGIALRRPELIDGLALICPAIIADAARRDLPPHAVLVEDQQLLGSLDPSEAEEFSSMAVVQNKY